MAFTAQTPLPLPPKSQDWHSTRSPAIPLCLPAVRCKVTRDAKADPVSASFFEVQIVGADTAKQKHFDFLPFKILLFCVYGASCPVFFDLDTEREAAKSIWRGMQQDQFAIYLFLLHCVMSLQENTKITEFIQPPWYDVETAPSTFIGRSCQNLWLCIFAVVRLFMKNEIQMAFQKSQWLKPIYWWGRRFMSCWQGREQVVSFGRIEWLTWRKNNSDVINQN